jgi:hypothetical protein
MTAARAVNASSGPAVGQARAGTDCRAVVARNRVAASQAMTLTARLPLARQGFI